jgi:cob(I)alamin adenosyltransferase
VNARPILADAGRAEIGLEEAETALRSGKFDLVLLSQILTAVDEGLLTEVDVLGLVSARPEHVGLILTGHTAPPDFCRRCAAASPSSSIDISSRSLAP